METQSEQNTTEQNTTEQNTTEQNTTEQNSSEKLIGQCKWFDKVKGFGFIRGIAFNGTYYFIGQSESRYFDRLKGIRNNIGMSAGFYLFDEDSKACKFFHIPQLHQVRDLVVLS